MEFRSGFEKYREREAQPRISSGDRTLDELLGGGLEAEVVYLLYGHTHRIIEILYSTIVHVLEYYKSEEEEHIVFADGYNRFNPYEVSKLAAAKRMSPTACLERVLISRAFTWEQMVELLENKIAGIETMRLFIVSGLTNLFPNYEVESFQALQKALSGVKRLLAHQKPIIILTGSRHPHSAYKPKGGKMLTHFGHVHVLIEDFDRKVEYSLVQHPTLPAKTLKKYKPRTPKRKFKKEEPNHHRLDKWL